MDEKTIQRIKKLQALAERGVGGEKTTAQKKLAKLLKDNGINSLDELQKNLNICIMCQTAANVMQQQQWRLKGRA